MDLSGMNLSGVSGFNEEYEVLPPGDYHVRIVDDKVKTTKSGTQYLNLRYDVVDGKYARRCIFDGLHFWNENETARRMAQQKLKSIAKAVHMPNPDFVQDSSDLLQREMLVTLRVKTDDYGEKNEVKLYKPLPAVQVGGPSSPAPATPPPPAARPAQRVDDLPWE